MNLAALTKRVQQFENHLKHHLSAPTSTPDDETTGWHGQLHELERAANRILRKAEARGDDHTALAAICELRRLLELSARLAGRLEEKSQVNVVQVELTAETAQRIAQTYLSRHSALEGSR